jgi:hypothetical protein
MLLGEPCNWVTGCVSPSTLCSPMACAYFLNKPYTNCILYDSCSTFLHITCLQPTNKLITVQYISLLISFRYHLVIVFLPAPTNAATGPSSQLLPCCGYNQWHTKASQSSSLPFSPTLMCCTVVCWHHSYFSFVTSFNIVTGPKCFTTISPFFNLLPSTSLQMFLPFNFSVPTQSVERSIFSCYANSGLLYKFSTCSVRPWPNKGSETFGTTAAVLGISGVTRHNSRTVFLPVMQENTVNIL